MSAPPAIYLEADARLGAGIDDVAAQMKIAAERCGVGVKSLFNGCTLYMAPDGDPRKMAASYRDNPRATAINGY